MHGWGGCRTNNCYAHWTNSVARGMTSHTLLMEIHSFIFHTPTELLLASAQPGHPLDHRRACKDQKVQANHRHCLMNSALLLDISDGYVMKCIIMHYLHLPFSLSLSPSPETSRWMGWCIAVATVQLWPPPGMQCGAGHSLSPRWWSWGTQHSSCSENPLSPSCTGKACMCILLTIIFQHITIANFVLHYTRSMPNAVNHTISTLMYSWLYS